LAFELANGPAPGRLVILLVKVRWAEILVPYAVAQHVVQADEQGMGDGDHGAFLAEARRPMGVWGREIGLALMHRRPGTLGQDRAQMPLARLEFDTK